MAHQLRSKDGRGPSYVGVQHDPDSSRRSIEAFNKRIAELQDAELARRREQEVTRYAEAMEAAVAQGIARLRAASNSTDSSSQVSLDLTIQHHGARSYSFGGKPPIVVTREEAGVLSVFAASGGAALNTKDLEKHVSNVSRIMGQLDIKFPGAVRRPDHKGEGYYIHVEPAY